MEAAMANATRSDAATNTAARHDIWAQATGYERYIGR
jgi:hypothetical protein